VKIAYDPKAKAAYITIAGDSPIAATKPVTDDCNLDLDIDGNVIGVELLGIESPPKILRKS